MADIEAELARQNNGDGPVWWDQISPRGNADYLVKGVINRGDFVSVYGESYTGKSHFALDLALSVAAGRPWRGHRVTQCAVLYVALEGWRGFENRVAARRREFEGEHVPLAVWTTSLDFSEPTTTGTLIEIVRRLAEVAPRIGLIVIDTVARAMGAVDENSSQGMGTLISASSRIQKETGASVLWIHHVGKDPGKGPRGHSSFFAALDTGIRISREDEKTSKAVIEKQKDGEGDRTWHFRVVSRTLGVDDDGDVITAGVPEFVDVAPAAQRETGPSGQAGKALGILRKLVYEIGELRPEFLHVPQGQPTVLKSEWQQACSEARLGEGGPSAEQKAFARAVETLEQRGYISLAGGHVWPQIGGGQAGQTRTDEGHDRSTGWTDMDTPLRGVSDVQVENGLGGDAVLDGYIPE
jgi:hypothetical protein